MMIMDRSRFIALQKRKLGKWKEKKEEKKQQTVKSQSTLRQELKLIDMGKGIFYRERLYKNPYADYSSPFFYTDKKNILFFDAETTGLSGGAGTRAFLIGLGYFKGDDFKVQQYFMADYPAEADFLEQLFPAFQKADLIVSYNGKSFDVPLLRDRFAFYGLQWEVPAQLDLLTFSRRLWRQQLASCDLGTIEKEILTIKRGLDIPGAQIPEIYFRFLDKGDFYPLRPVFSHHEQDIHSLALLSLQIEKIMQSPLDYTDYSYYGLIKIFEDFGLLQKKQHLLCEAELTEQGRPAYMLSLLLKQQKMWPRALSLWQNLAEQGDLKAYVELAKYYEHRIKDLTKALQITRQVLGLAVEEKLKSELLHRKERLLRKLKLESRSI